MSKKASSGFVNPMAMQKTLEQEAGAEPLQLVPQAASSKAVQSPALPSPTSSTSPTPKEDFPWVNAHPKVKVHFGLRMSERLHRKFEYAANHTLGHSMQTFALVALEEAVDKRLKELGVI